MTSEAQMLDILFSPSNLRIDVKLFFRKKVCDELGAKGLRK